MHMPRIEPTIASDSIEHNALPRTIPSSTKLPLTIAAIRRSNQRKIAITSSVLFAIMAGLVAILLSSKPSISLTAVSYRLGQSLSFFLIAAVVALGFTFFGKKQWTWGFAVFLLVILLVPIFVLGT
jgi:membrane-associated HD superfamily phosphohydrolase